MRLAFAILANAFSVSEAREKDKRERDHRIVGKWRREMG
jgi:hypothetical protein